MRPEKDKVEMLTALAAAGFAHYKKLLQSEGNECLPPTPNEARDAYQNDPLINRCADTMVMGIINTLLA